MAKFRLEPLSMKHISKKYISWFNDPEICRYNRHGSGYTVDNAVDYILNLDKNNIKAFAVMVRSTHIGNISVTVDNVNKSGELAIILGKRANHGMGTEAWGTLIEYSFSKLSLHRLWCGIDSQNKAMLKVAINNGMVPEGVRRNAFLKNGYFRDIVMYAILRNNWRVK